MENGLEQETTTKSAGIQNTDILVVGCHSYAEKCEQSKEPVQQVAQSKRPIELHSPNSQSSSRPTSHSDGPSTPSSSESKEAYGLARKVRFIDGLMLPRAEPRGLMLADHPVTLLRRHELKETNSQSETHQKGGSAVLGFLENVTGDSTVINEAIDGKQATSLSRNIAGSNPGKRKKASQQIQALSIGGNTSSDS